MRTLSLLYCLMLFLSNCSNDKSITAESVPTTEDSAAPEMEAKMEEAPPPPSPSSPADHKAAPTIEIKLIKTGNLEFQTSDLGKTYQRVRQAAQTYAGFLSNESTSNEYDRIVQHLTIRVPSRNFDLLVDAVSKGVNHFDIRNIEAVDVTEEFVDAEARLKTKKQVEQRYQDLLKRAGKISEILEIERQIGELRAEIESIEGRLRYLNNRVDYSTLDVSFYTKIKPREESSGPHFGDALLNGWKGLVIFLFGLTSLWPLLLVLLGIFIWWRNRKKV